MSFVNERYRSLVNLTTPNANGVSQSASVGLDTFSTAGKIIVQVGSANADMTLSIVDENEGTSLFNRNVQNQYEVVEVYVTSPEVSVTISGNGQANLIIMATPEITEI